MQNKRAKSNPRQSRSASGRYRTELNAPSVTEAKKRRNALPAAKGDKGSKKKGRKGWIIALALFLAFDVAAAIGLYSFVFLSNTNAQLEIEDKAELMTVLETSVDPEDPFYMLVLGIDTRGNTRGNRSDTIILARIDPSKRAVTLLSIPRDVKVTLSNDGLDHKINAAFAYGGSALSVTTVSDLCDVPISHVAVINFDGVEDLVDALGGVTVTVPPNTMVDDVWVPEGLQTINGEQALIFARCRLQYAKGDLQRAENQRALVAAVAQKILASNVLDMPDIISACCSFVSTDMEVSDIVDLAMRMRGMESENIISCVAPIYNSYEDGVSYMRLYEDQFHEMLKKFKAGEDPNQ